MNPGYKFSISGTHIAGMIQMPFSLVERGPSTIPNLAEPDAFDYVVYIEIAF